MTYVKKNLTADDITSYESMYESPFSLKISEMCDEIAKAINNDTETAVMRSIADIGINVDKEELIKALQYDRDQYNKGYSDGARFGFEAGKPKWIPIDEELPEEETDVLICNGNGDIEISRGSYSTEVENDFIWYTSGWRFGKVIAWMPLPEPYAPQESEVDDE